MPSEIEELRSDLRLALSAVFEFGEQDRVSGAIERLIDAKLDEFRERGWRKGHAE